MAESSENRVVEHPRVYLIRMMVFIILVAIVFAALIHGFIDAFMANPWLNGLIVFTLFLGIVYAFRMVWRLFPEVSWINSFSIADPNLENSHAPRLLAPMATLLRDRQRNTVLSTQSMRSLLDSLASRLDESRDISRYMIGLLIFLGLLGTFWGLLQTVSSVGTAIKQLDVTAAESGAVFDSLKAGLEAPLAGMGTSFSSSLFGLAGSLILGFLDLQASQAQNRFYTDLEDWLSSITDIEAGDAGPYDVPQYLRLDMSQLQDGINRVNRTLEDALNDTTPGPPPGGSDVESLNKLADAVGSLVHQMREEQKVVRRWAQEQSDQQHEIRNLLAGVAREAPNPGPAPVRSRSKPRDSR